MHRGIFHIKPDQIKHIDKTILEGPLKHKLEALANNAHTEIELSAEESEVLLDNLPVPETNEEESLKQLRYDLREFLNSIQNN